MKKSRLLLSVGVLLLFVGVWLTLSGKLSSLQGVFTFGGSQLDGIVTADATPWADIVIAGTPNFHFSTYTFDTGLLSGEPVTVEDLKILVQGNSLAVSTITIVYPDSTGTVITQSATVSGGSVTFNDLDFYFGKGNILSRVNRSPVRPQYNLVWQIFF